MQTQSKNSQVDYQYDNRERNEELIGVLTAISIISKRLAGKLTALEHRHVEKPRGGETAYGQDIRT